MERHGKKDRGDKRRKPNVTVACSSRIGTRGGASDLDLVTLRLGEYEQWCVACGQIELSQIKLRGHTKIA